MSTRQSKRRPCSLEWILDIVRQCAAANVPCFVKQIPVPKWKPQHDHIRSKPMTIGEMDKWIEILGWRVSHDPAEWPEELRVREMP